MNKKNLIKYIRKNISQEKLNNYLSEMLEEYTSDDYYDDYDYYDYYDYVDYVDYYDYVDMSLRTLVTLVVS